MKLIEGYQYIVLCEDAQMDTFIRSFLKGHGLTDRKIRTIPIPAGKGCGEQHVRVNFAKEIKILHSSSFNKRVLIVCTDADSYSYNERKNTLVQMVRESDATWTLDNEMLLLWIPKRAIETWIAFFDNEDTNENKTYIHAGKPISCKNEVHKMMLFCQGEYSERNEILPSLIKAKEEYERVCRLQEKRENIL